MVPGRKTEPRNGRLKGICDTFAEQGKATLSVRTNSPVSMKGLATCRCRLTRRDRGTLQNRPRHGSTKTFCYQSFVCRANFQGSEQRAGQFTTGAVRTTRGVPKTPESPASSSPRHGLFLKRTWAQNSRFRGQNSRHHDNFDVPLRLASSRPLHRHSDSSSQSKSFVFRLVCRDAGHQPRGER